MFKSARNYSFALAAAVCLTMAADGCRSSRKREQPRKGVGFQLEGASSVTKGALITQPEGREEAFLSLVAGHAADWVTACQALRKAGEDAPSFSFVTVSPNALRAEPTPGETAFEACLARTASATTATALTPETTIRAQLSLRP